MMEICEGQSADEFKVGKLSPGATLGEAVYSGLEAVQSATEWLDCGLDDTHSAPRLTDSVAESVNSGSELVIPRGVQLLPHGH